MGGDALSQRSICLHARGFRELLPTKWWLFLTPVRQLLLLALKVDL